MRTKPISPLQGLSSGSEKNRGPGPTLPPASPLFSLRLAVGLCGVLLAVLLAGFNEHVTEGGLADLGGALHLGHDEATWLTALFEAFNIAAMAFAPWFAVTFSIRRLSLAMIALAALSALWLPFCPTLGTLYLTRCIQGIACGSLPPLLMTVALRYLPPNIKIYGLGAYALTSTFGPNLGIPLTGVIFEYAGWYWLFWEIIPLCVLSMIAIGWGLPQDPLRLERFRQFDWVGMLTGLPAICFLVIGLVEGDRLDWFRSPLITHLLLGGSVLFIAFLLNEWHHPLPFFRIQLLSSRNVSDSLLTLTGVLILDVATLQVPEVFLTDVHHYRPIQITPLALRLALPQLITLPLVAALCNLRRVDCRHVLLLGLGLQALSYFLGTWIDFDWVRDNFDPTMALQTFSQPMIVIPILMLATLSLQPTDGPFISGMFNMTKGFAAAIATALLSALLRRREQYHSTMLLDHHGGQRFLLQSLNDGARRVLAPLLPDPAVLKHTSTVLFHDDIRTQAIILTCADIYVTMIGICAAMFALNLFLPLRVYPPSAPRPDQSARKPSSPPEQVTGVFQPPAGARPVGVLARMALADRVLKNLPFRKIRKTSL
ncbi:MFS transporter [Oecophyllibacter saccharovorans]|uniref:MFS transporter n=1 Tax=Oecophyllibacter saccharovorans TaxID=2558360 RepID=UPI0011416E50|nr:MFS transporter [Oecophyllibacter saccharovorans]QDH15813.1 MFS transporter [Oecophyllibacter saccharovorans]